MQMGVFKQPVKEGKEKGIAENDKKTYPVYSGYISNLNQGERQKLGVSQILPGKPGQEMGFAIFKKDPDEREGNRHPEPIPFLYKPCHGESQSKV
jgi:hypothetical protein